MSLGPTCRHCPARIIWRRHERTGNLAPIDADATSDGNIILVDADTYRIATAADGLDGRPRFKNHWATCTNPPKKGR